jgi:hypothetical protein
MEKNKIITVCNKYVAKFDKVTEGEKFHHRGILNSESLLMNSIISELGIENIFESGRAKGHSTNLFCKFFKENKNMKITSLDFDKNQKDSKFSEKFLSKFKNLNLIYGDSMSLLPKLIEKNSAVFIDGPKGDEAIVLASNLLKNKNVKVIFIHDLAKGFFQRDIVNELFPCAFFTDDLDFVDNFSNLDDICWKVEIFFGFGPYMRHSHSCDSYGPTLAMIFNDSNIDFKKLDRYVEYYSFLSNGSIKSFILKNLKTNSITYKLIEKIVKLYK